MKDIGNNYRDIVSAERSFDESERTLLICTAIGIEILLHIRMEAKTELE